MKRYFGRKLRGIVLAVLALFTALLFSFSAMAAEMDDLLFKGINDNNMQYIQIALENHANINGYKDGNTPLIRAIIKNRELVPYLIQQGADVNLCSADYPYLPPLFVAVGENDKGVAEYLLKKGVDVNCRDGKKVDTVLTFLCSKPIDNRSYELLQFLVSKGANVNSQNENGNTPLSILAGKYGANEITVKAAKFLLQSGAKKDIVNNSGNTALQRAISAESKPMIDLLLGWKG